MRIVIDKIIFCIAFLGISWFGLGGLLVNMKSTEDIFDISYFEKYGDSSLRYLAVANGVALGEYHFEVSPYFSSRDAFIYPIVSKENWLKYQERQPIEVKVFVKRNDLSNYCIENGTCFLADSTQIRGITVRRFDAGDFPLENAELISIADDAILIEEGASPYVWYWNLVMFVIGGIFGLTILSSFFKKSSNFAGYWDKVTEKNAY